MTHQEDGRIILTTYDKDNRHQIIFLHYNEAEGTVIDCSIKLNTDQPFLKRLSIGLKYILGIKNKHKEYLDFSLNQTHVVGLLEVITKLKSDSNVVQYALNEFRIAGYLEGDEMNALMAKQVIELLSVFSNHGHSGFSAPYAVSLFSKLANWEIISPLTFEADEWTQKYNFIDDDKEYYQNKRNGSIFRSVKGTYSIDAFVKSIKSTKYFGSDNIVRSNAGNVTGTVFESNNGIATGRGFRTCYFKDEDIAKKRVPESTIYLPVTQIEVQKDDWLMFVDVKSTRLKELNNLYRIDWFEVESLKDQPIISLTHNHGY